jgi:phosphate-selective porin OprO and OprP
MKGIVWTITHCVVLLGPVNTALGQNADVATATDFSQVREREAAHSESAAGQSNTNEPPASVYDRIWKLTEWYNDAANPVIQRLRFSGRYQQDYATVSSDQGDASEWNVRRLRLGLRATLLKTVIVHTEADINPQEADPLFVRLTDAYVEWSPGDQVAVTIGKQGVSFTLDGTTSSKELLAMERSNLANNIWFSEEYLPGLAVSGSSAPWIYAAGLYSAGEKNREFGEFNGGIVTLGTIGYDFAKSIRAEQALLTLNYVYQDPHPRNTFTQPLQHVVSINFRFERERWGLQSDLAGAAGYFDQSDIYGVMVMPFINATKELQFVGRYTFLDSHNENGIELATYEDRVVSGRGDRYNDFYFGANYYFYGHQLKLQTGVQIADMKDAADDGGAYSGVSWTAGLRLGW